MCNLSEGAILEGYRKGNAAGIEAGIAEGRKEERDRFLAVAAAMVSDGTLALKDAATRFGFTEQELRSAMT